MKTTKRYLINWLILSLTIGLVAYVVFSFQNKVYKSSGKYNLAYADPASVAKANPYQSTLNPKVRSLTEYIKSRAFVEQLFKQAEISYSNDEGSTDKIIQASVIKESDIIQVEIKTDNLTDLHKINEIFLVTLNDSSFVSGQEPKIKVEATDPLYVSSKPIYPKPLEYSLLAFVACFCIGVATFYTLATPKAVDTLILHERD